MYSLALSKTDVYLPVSQLISKYHSLPSKQGTLEKRQIQKYGNMSERHRIDLEEVPTEKKKKKTTKKNLCIQVSNLLIKK